MLGKSHIKIALGVSMMVSSNPGVMICSAIGSLLPDIEHPKSKLGRFFLPNRLKSLRKKIQHRGVTHSALFSLIFNLIVLLLFDIITFVGVSIGYISHILSDMLTIEGVQLCWPKEDRVSIANIRTDSFAEWIVSTFIFALGVFILLVRWSKNV